MKKIDRCKKLKFIADVNIEKPLIDFLKGISIHYWGRY